MRKGWQGGIAVVYGFVESYERDLTLVIISTALMRRASPLLGTQLISGISKIPGLCGTLLG